MRSCRDEGEARAEGVPVDLDDIAFSEEDRSTARAAEAEEEFQKRGFTGATRADDGELFTRR